MMIKINLVFFNSFSNLLFEQTMNAMSTKKPIKLFGRFCGLQSSILFILSWRILMGKKQPILSFLDFLEEKQEFKFVNLVSSKPTLIDQSLHTLKMVSPRDLFWTRPF